MIKFIELTYYSERKTFRSIYVSINQIETVEPYFSSEGIRAEVTLVSGTNIKVSAQAEDIIRDIKDMQS